MLIFVQLLLVANFLKGDLESARREALSACLALEQTSSVVASLPHYMAIGLNTMTTKGIEASVSALATTYSLILLSVLTLEPH